MEDLQSEELYRRRINQDIVDPLPPSRVPARETLSGRFVAIEPMDAEQHAQELFEAGHGSTEKHKIWDYLPYGPWSDAEAYACVLRQQSASFDPIFYAIRSQETGKAVGQITFMEIAAQHGTIEIGHIWFAPELQRTRAATEALFLMISHAMDNLGYRRMQWKCNAMNAKSRMAAGRLGFRFEGVHFNHLIVKGQNRDTAWYSILDHEWPKLRGAYETWLSDDNFNADGVQETSLSDLIEAARR